MRIHSEEFFQELQDIFMEVEKPKSILKTQTPPLKTNLKAEKPLKSIIMEKPMVLAPVLEAPEANLEGAEEQRNLSADAQIQVKNQSRSQFLEAKVEKQIDAEAVLESKQNAQNQVKNQTVANVQDKSLDPKFLEAELEGKTEAQTQAEATFLEAEVEKQIIDSEAVLGSKENAKNQVKTKPLPKSKTNHWIQIFWRLILRAR